MTVTKAVEDRRSAKVLYISYDGLTDPLGRSQVLPYLAGLAEWGYQITILSCEKPGRLMTDGARIRNLCEQAGINWHPLKYHKRPPILSSAFDAYALERAAFRLHRQEAFDIVHCRSYIPARAGLALKKRFGVRFLFDMRGFWPDEKVEGRNWNLSNPLYAAVYRYFKRLESQLLRSADHIVSLTEAAKHQLLTRPEVAGGRAPITVIPCCVDFDHFPLPASSARKLAREQLGLDPDAAVLAYLGSLGSWYMLDEMLDFFGTYASRHRGARFLFVTLDDPHLIRSSAKRRSLDPGQIIIRPAGRDEVPVLMAAADIGIFFIKPVFSKLASCPTKMGEMLALGLPLVANNGVGDVAPAIEEMGCGVAITTFDAASYLQAVERIQQIGGTPSERREKAKRMFDVRLGVERYERIYRDLAGGDPDRSAD